MPHPRWYGWVVVAATFALLFLGFAAAYSFGAFFAAFQAEFGAARADVALVFSLSAFLWFVVGAPGGMLTDRLGPRWVTLAGVACLVLGLWLASRAQSVTMLYVTYGIGIGLGVGLTYVPSVGALQPWFQANRGLASGIAISGIGAGNIAGPILAAWWIERYGWREAFVAFAIATLLAGGAAALAMDAPARQPGVPLPGTALREAMKGRSFWLLFAALALNCVGLFVPMVHLAAYAQDAGHSEARAVALLSLLGLGSLLGRFLIGPFADRFGRQATTAGLFAGLGAMMLLWWSTTVYWLLGVFAVAFGAFYGAYVALLPAITMDIYGPRAVSGIIGALFVGAGLGTLVGPWLAGLAYDAFARYDAPILAGALLSFAAAWCIVLLVSHEAAQARHRRQ